MVRVHPLLLGFMFTGIISHLGSFLGKKGSTFSFCATGALLEKVVVGDSIAVNGVCLTVTRLLKESFTADLIPETLKRTNLGTLNVGEVVNLEMPLSATASFDGHIVQGHVDGKATTFAITKKGNSRLFRFQLEDDLDKYIVEKGSIAVNGVSLTVIKVEGNNFEVGIIPYTFKNTNFGNLRVGDSVNIEVDMMTKYIEKLVVHYLKNVKKSPKV